MPIVFFLCFFCFSDKVCRRLLHRELYGAFRSWKEFLDHAALNSMRAQLNDEKSKRVRALIEKWTRSTLIPSFQSWANHTRDTKRARAEAEVHRKATLDSILRRMAHSS